MFKEWLYKILNRKLDKRKKEIIRLRWKKARLEQIKQENCNQ